MRGGAFFNGKEGQVDFRKNANLIAKRLRATFLSPTRGTEGVVKTIERNGYILRPFVKGEGLGVG